MSTGLYKNYLVNPNELISLLSELLAKMGNDLLLFKEFLQNVTDWEFDFIFWKHIMDIGLFLSSFESSNEMLLQELILRFVVSDRGLEFRIHCFQAML